MTANRSVLDVIQARSLRIRGTVQGVGFRPFVYRLATRHALTGWVLNGEDGVRVHVEGSEVALDAFTLEVEAAPPRAARITGIDVIDARVEGFDRFEIRASVIAGKPSVRVAPDLPVCSACLDELFTPGARRHLYPYINCTECGPRFSIVFGLPYDRERTTMREWPMCTDCAAEFREPRDRRFHAQPIACPQCGPQYVLRTPGGESERGEGALRRVAQLLRDGQIVAVKGIGGYHLACDATNRAAVSSLRDRKFRKEKPFAVMARDLETARELVALSLEAEALLLGPARPIVLAPARGEWPEVAPSHRDLGVMLPFAPLHHLLYALGAPPALVLTSGNRSSEPIAYEDADALDRLGGIADAFLIGERAIARRVDDSVARVDALGPVILRRSRGYAPGVVARLPAIRPILAIGADLKNAITVVVDGDAFVSQHIGNLEHYDAVEALRRTAHDLLALYEVRSSEAVVVHDLHPEYASTAFARSMTAAEVMPVQHHRAHVASVLAERGALDVRVVGVAFDGTGYGDDGTIWGGEFLVGSLAEGFDRVAHLRGAALPGGDAAARFPVQAAAGFLAQLDDETSVDLLAPPFSFPNRYRQAAQLVSHGVRVFETTSVGRLFDAAAALLGFTRTATYEGQAAMWLEQLARGSPASEQLSCPFVDGQLDWRPLLRGLIDMRVHAVPREIIARAFHSGVAKATASAAANLCQQHEIDVVVLSGGVFQNALLLNEIRSALPRELHLWTNHAVPPNDGGISLGQAAVASATLTR